MSDDDDFDSYYISFEEIESATNNFADENLLTQGSSFMVYKGQLKESDTGDLINIVARKPLRKSIARNEMIYARVLKHKNIASAYKFSIREYGPELLIMVHKYEANGSLDKHLGDTTLTWMQRLRICAGVAHALKYLHNDLGKDGESESSIHNDVGEAGESIYCIIHGNIKSSKILLDHNWEPKLHGFGHAIAAKKNQVYLTSKYNGPLQYMDPAYENTKGLTHKSDVFSFGVLLFEVLFGREASIENDDNWYFARLARSRYEERQLDDLIDPDVRRQMSFESLNIFTDIAYYCLKEKRSERPDIKQVVSKLDEALEIQRKYENPTLAATVEGTSVSDRLKGKNLDHLKFQLSDILLATENFCEAYCIGSGGFAKVYKAKLNHHEGIEEKDECNVPMNYNVAIKRIEKHGEPGFIGEIEMLCNCKHTNIVSLLGFCDEEAEMILVSEYVSNGSLADCLENKDNMINLTWDKRIQICLDIAHGLNYLHTKQGIVHRDIKSDNILLNDEWVAKITDFGLSKLRQDKERNTIVTKTIAGTEVYMDPEYMSTGHLKAASDIYSFGVVMFEMLSGKLAYDATFGRNGLPPIARQCFNEGTMKKLVDPRLMESDENISMLIEGVNGDSLNTFSKVAYQCLKETQSERPTMEDIITELTNALNLQINSKDKFRIPLKAIKTATSNFSDGNCIGEGRLWKLYEGNADGFNSIFAKRWAVEGYYQFLRELEVLVKYNHKNIIGFVGYCNEDDEKIIVYQHASNGRLDKHVEDHSLTWMQRVKICIGIAEGLEFLHYGGEQKAYRVIHGDLKSGSILLDGDWNAKISNFEMSRKITIMDIESDPHVNDYACDSLGYANPEYKTYGFLTEGSDIYSLGVILVEMLCGRLAWAEGCVDHSQSLGPLVARHYKEKRNLNEMIFEGIKEQIAPRSLTAFRRIALSCLHDTRDERPRAGEVVRELNMALMFQEDYQIWKPKLPLDYKKILLMSKYSKINPSSVREKDLYDKFSEGILLHDDKVFFKLGSNGERNEMISATMFSYKSRKSRKWLSIPESRFKKVAEMFDKSKLNIRIKITPQLLSPGITYGAYIIFKFSDTRKFSGKPMYVNLKYRKGGENLNAFFATWRDDKWMEIEVCRFLCQEKDTDFEVLLESFSRYYCGKSSVYVEGIEFRVIDKVKNEATKQAQQMLKLNLNKDQEMNGKKHLMLSAKEVLHDSSNVKLFHLRPSAESRFQEMIELLPQHVFRINYKIKRWFLLHDTEYICYLVFKLSEKCVGLHCPVIVRDLARRNNKEAEIIYFRSPSLCNLHENTNVPRQREDGWMEVKVLKFNSHHQLKNDCILVNLKLITYEGTMSGLVLCGLELRAM